MMITLKRGPFKGSNDNLTISREEKKLQGNHHVLKTKF